MNVPSRRDLIAATIIVAVLALAASFNSIGNGFVYDDNFVIVKAEQRHTLAQWWTDFAHTYWPEAWGGDGYRPLTVIAFRLQWVLGGGDPALYHGVSIAIHVVTSALVFWLSAAFLPIAAAAIAGALYAVHPVHVEAIANVVGQSELFVGLLTAIMVGLYLRVRRRGNLEAWHWVVIGFLYLVACFFKEHALVLPALLVLAEFTIVRDSQPVRKRVAQLRLPFLALAAVGVAYLGIRSTVVVGGGSGFVPFLPFQVVRFSDTDRVLTAIGIAPEWLRLLVWPARLSAEYSPPFVEIAQGFSVTQIPGLLVLAGLVGVAFAARKRVPAATFGIGWALVTLLPVSNLLIPAGFIIAERTLLLPSMGAMIAIGSAVPWLFARLEPRPALQFAGAAVVAAIVALGITRSVTRNEVWRSDDSLFRQSVVDAPDSYRAHYILGTYLMQKKRKREGEAHYRRALELFPHDPIVRFALAEQYREFGICRPAIDLYRSAFEIAPNMRDRQLGLAACLLQTLELDEARNVALSAISSGASVKDARLVLYAAKVGRDSLIARRARGDTLWRQIP